MDPSEDMLGNMLQALLAGRLECWFLCSKEENSFGKIIGVFTTTIVGDPIVGVRHLLIYTMSGTNSYIPDCVWKREFETLAKYARLKHCNSIRIMTVDDRVIDIVEKLGGEVVMNVVDLEV